MSALSITENPSVRSNPSVLTEFTKVRDLIKREKNVLSLSQPASFILDLKTSNSQPHPAISPQSSIKEYFNTQQIQQAKAISSYFQREDLKITTNDAYQEDDADFKNRARCQSIEQLESQWNTIKKQCKFNSRGNSPTNLPENLRPNSVRGRFELKNLQEARQTSQEQRQPSRDEDSKAVRLFLKSIKQKNKNNTSETNVLETSIKLQDSKDVSQTGTVVKKDQAIVKKISHILVKVSPRTTGRDDQVQGQAVQRIDKDLSSQRNISHRLEKGFDKKWFNPEPKGKAQEISMSSGLWGDIFSTSKNGESNHNNSNAAISDTTIGSQRVFPASVKSQVSVKADIEMPQCEQASKTGDKAGAIMATPAISEDKEAKKEGNEVKKEMVKIIRVIEKSTNKRETRPSKKNDTSKKKIVLEDQEKDASASLSLLLTESKSRASSANSKRFPETKISERAKSLLRCIKKCPEDSHNSLISSPSASIMSQSGAQTPTKTKPILIPQLDTIKEIRKNKSSTKTKPKKEDCSQDAESHKTEPKKHKQFGLALTITGVTETKKPNFLSPKKSSTGEFNGIGSFDKNHIPRGKSPNSVREDSHTSNQRAKPQEKPSTTEKQKISIKGVVEVKEKRTNPRNIHLDAEDHGQDHGFRKAESLHVEKIKIQRPATENQTPKTIKGNASTGPTDQINTVLNMNMSSKASNRVDALRSQLKEKNKESHFKARAQGKNEDSKVKLVINLK